MAKGLTRYENVVEGVAVWAEATPSAIAVRSGQGVLTFGDLERRANGLARKLLDCGVAAEVTVGIYAERALELPVMLLAVLKAGGAYVPLDPSYPDERVQWIVEDVGCRVLLTQPHLRSKLSGAEAHIICMGEGADADLSAYEDSAVCVKLQQEQLAYVIYTSGSTGRPKGVMIDHGALVNHMRWMAERFPLSPEDRVLQKTAIGFDASVWEFWAPLMSGAELVMARPGGHRDSAYLAEVLRDQKVTILQVVPSMLQALLEEEVFCANRHLRRVFCGGEVLQNTLAQAFRKKLPIELVNLYGPTEATIDATYWVCGADDDGPTVPIGNAISNTALHLLDDSGHPVVDGEIGELYIAGAGVGRGYVNRPDITAEKFLSTPQGSGRMYRTGDRVRRLRDGALEFVGRVDHQIKLRGHRIELPEIEAVLSAHPALRSNAVVESEQRLVAFVTSCEAGADASDLPTDVRRYAARKLPDYMVPDVVVCLKELPLTSNGKVDRGVLKQIARRSANSQPRGPAPRNETEAAIARIWCGLLGRDSISVDEDFFDIGGDSLLATRLAARLRQAFRVELPLQAVFDHRRIDRLAEIVVSATLPRAESGIKRVSREVPAPLSFAQERVWFIQQVVPMNMAYAFRTVTRLLGPLNIRALEQALTEIVRRHEIFRTTFPMIDGNPVQQVQPSWGVELPVLDLSRLSSLARAEADRIIAEEFRRGFNLERLPLIRWTLIRLREGEHLLAQIEHHLVHDGWSFNIYLRELKELYAAYVAGRPSPLPELPLQFSDLAAWQRHWMATGSTAERQLDFWRQSLAGAPPVLDLKASKPRPAEPSFRGELHRIEVPALIARQLRAFCRREKATLFMTMLAAFKVLLHKYSGRTDLIVGTGVANRRWVESESIMGMLLNNLALRTRLDGDPTFRELLSRVRRTTLDAYAHQDVPFERVVEAMNLPRDLRYNPLAQVMFSFHDAPLPDLDVGDLRIEVTDLMDNGSAKFDLSLIVIPRLERATGTGALKNDESILAIWEFNTDLFDRDTIRQLSQDYLHLLGSLPACADARLSAIVAPSAVPVLLHLPGDVTERAVRRAVAELVRRHVSLQPRMVDYAHALNDADEGGVVTVNDLSREPIEVRGARLDQLITADCGEVFDICGAPLLRARLMKYEATKQILLLLFHPLAAGDTGVDPFVTELAALAQAPDTPHTPRASDENAKERARAFWTSELASWPEPLRLPTDRRRDLQSAPRPASLTRSLAELGLADVQHRAGAAGAGLFDVLLALFQVLLYRHAGQEEFAVGIRINARADIEQGAPFGFAEDLLALRTRIDKSLSLREWVQAVGDRCETILSQARLPYRAMAALAGPRPGGLFQTIFSLQTNTPAPITGTPWTIASIESPVDGLEMEWRARVEGDGLELQVQYDAAVFDSLAVDRMIEQFGVLVKSAVQAWQSPIDEIPLLPEWERRRLLVDWNATDRAFPEPFCAHELFKFRAEHSADAVALVYGDTKISYGELDGRSESLARKLVTLGVGPDSFVALYCRRSIEMVVGMLAIAKAGGAYVPLDAGYPQERIAYILDETDARVVLSEGALVSGLPTGDRTVICLDAMDDLETSVTVPLGRRAHPRDLAYVIYTSGTTGRPKGVMVEHRNLTNFLSWFVHEYALGAGKVAVVHSPLVFDLTVSTLWGPLISGGTALLLPEGDTQTLAASFARVGNAGLVKVTPAHLDLLSNTLTLEQRACLAEVLIVAGEVFPAAAAESWRKAAPCSRIVNFYGPTEITVGCAVHDIGATVDPHRSVPIGRPIANSRMYVLDSKLQPAPIGVAGEIYIGGSGVSRGYLKQPHLTAERFINSPFEPGDRLYRSGDIGRVRADGSIEYLGRIDNQVKLRGFRVELGEVESVLAAHPDIAEVAAVINTSLAEKILVAWVVPRKGCSLSADSLREFASRKLPAYMVPAAVGFINALPLTANGKVNRAALSASAVLQPNLEFVAPQTITERKLSDIWARLLGHDRPSRDSDFFSVGGNSLMAVRLIGQTRTLFGVELPIRAIFDHPTIRALARHIENLQCNDHDCSTEQGASRLEALEI